MDKRKVNFDYVSCIDTLPFMQVLMRLVVTYILWFGIRYSLLPPQDHCKSRNEDNPGLLDSKH